MYKYFLKRLMDIVISGIAIIVLALPMLIVTIAIKIDDPGPVLFKQKRVGKKKNGEITEDDLKNLETKIQKLTDKFVAQIDEIVAAKEKEILEV